MSDTRRQIQNAEIVYKNEEFLGFKLVSTKNIDFIENKREELTLPKYSTLLKAVFASTQNNLHYESVHDQDRTIYIDSLNITALDFYLQQKDKKNLIELGQKSIEDSLGKQKMGNFYSHL